MTNLLSKINHLKNSEIKNKINERIKEFKSINLNNPEEVFKELSFCILTANFQAKKSIEIQKNIDNGFLTLNHKQLSEKLKKLGHRFPNTRAKYIVESRTHLTKIPEILKTRKDQELRNWFIKNIKGLGLKESSHFLRNIGFDNYAIIDFHIIDILSENNYIQKPKSLTKTRYIEIENTLKEIAKTLKLTLSELDLYLWYLETGTILK